MRGIKGYPQRYISFILRMGKIKSTVLGIAILLLSSAMVHYLLAFLFNGIDHVTILQSVVFGAITAPFVVYFYHLLIERLEKTRILLEDSLAETKRFKSVIEEQNRDKGELLATLSHELRTPLNGIVGLSQILLDTHLTDEQHQYLQSIHANALSLGCIFRDLIDLEKIDRTGIELSPSTTSFPLIIANIRHTAMVLASDKKIELSMQIDDNLPPFIILDQVRLNQILYNLLSNAVKFSDEHGYIKIIINRLAQDRFQFQVQDNGCGIDKSEQEHIFKLYYQVAGSKKGQGSGIGLAISRNIARLMGGDLTVESVPNQGSIFYLTIRADEVHESTKTPMVSNFALNALVVEDVHLNVIIAKAFLEKLGLKVDVAYDGKSAYDLLSKKDYDLLLLDIQLPDTTGFVIATNLRREYVEKKRSTLPLIIALSANIRIAPRDFIAQGMDDVLHKPLIFNDLHHCLARHFTPSHKLPTEQRPRGADAINYPLISDFANLIGTQALIEQLKLFEQSFAKYLDDLQKMLDNNTLDDKDYQAIGKLAHKMKGALLTIGLSELAKVCEWLETESQAVKKSEHFTKAAEPLFEYRQHTQHIYQFLESHHEI